MPVTDADKITCKHKLKLFALAIIEQRITAAKTIIKNAQEAANSEGKSSAGDKYETARAMSHLEKDMHSRQLAQQIEEQALLHQVKTDIIYHSAIAGACIVSSSMIFFIAAGLGKQIVEERNIIFLSPHAPLAKLLQHKKAGDHFLFNGTQTTILEVY